MIYLLVLGFFSVPMSAKDGVIDVVSIIKESFDKNVIVQRDKLFLSNEEKQSVKEMAKLPVKSKIYRYYSIKKDENILGYGILISQKVRSKKATVLYIIDKNETMRSIEILAFLEPKEYIPKATWMGQFDDKNLTDAFTIGRDLPTISGATMSARTLSDGARLAISIYKIKLK